MRINKFLSFAGFCSRRKADALIKLCRVTLNGRVANCGDQIKQGDIVRVDDKIITEINNKVYLMYNKPFGVICTMDKNSSKSLISVIDFPIRVYPVGRLDVNSTGLLLLTNDGSFANKITHPRFEHEKEYEVTLDKEFTDEFIMKMSCGVEILNQITLPAKVFKITSKSFGIVLKQGLNRQIRRMCDALGYRVLGLKRIRIMNVKLGNLKNGELRQIPQYEIKQLLQNLKLDDIKK